MVAAALHQLEKYVFYQFFKRKVQLRTESGLLPRDIDLI
jgi:hypothetical protein